MTTARVIPGWQDKSMTTPTHPLLTFGAPRTTYTPPPEPERFGWWHLLFLMGVVISVLGVIPIVFGGGLNALFVGLMCMTAGMIGDYIHDEQYPDDLS